MSTTKSMKSITDAATAAFEKSQELYKCGEHQKAVKYIDMAITIDPQYYKYYFYRSLCLDALGYFLDALEDAKLSCQLAVESGTRDLKYHFHLASLQVKLDFFGDASLTLNSALALEGKLNPLCLHKNATWIRKLDEMRRKISSTIKQIDKFSACSTEDYHYQFHAKHACTFHSQRNKSHSSDSHLSYQSANESPSSKLRSRNEMFIPSSGDSIAGISTITGSISTISKSPSTTRSKALPPISNKAQKIKTCFPVYEKINWKEYRKSKSKEEQYVQAFSNSFASSRHAAAELISFLGSFDAHNPNDMGIAPEDNEDDDYQPTRTSIHNQDKNCADPHLKPLSYGPTDVDFDDLDTASIVISGLHTQPNTSLEKKASSTSTPICTLRGALDTDTFIQLKSDENSNRSPASQLQDSLRNAKGKTSNDSFARGTDRQGRDSTKYCIGSDTEDSIILSVPESRTSRRSSLTDRESADQQHQELKCKTSSEKDVPLASNSSVDQRMTLLSASATVKYGLSFSNRKKLS